MNTGTIKKNYGDTDAGYKVKSKDTLGPSATARCFCLCFAEYKN